MRAIVMIIKAILWAVCILEIAVCAADTMDYDSAWEEKEMLTQEELEELANDLWEQES